MERGNDNQTFVASGNDGCSSSKKNRMMIFFIVFIAFISGMFFRFTIRHPDPYNLENQKPNLRDTNSFALHALSERKLDAPWTSINVICGLAQNYVDENGITWVPDDIYAKGGEIRTSTTIANHLGANERYWDVVIPNYSGEQVSVPTLGVYTVTIYLSEIYYRESEKRLFNIAVGDETMKTLFTRNIDLYATYGYGSLQAFDIDVTVTTGWINIWVVNVSVGDPKISAFSIIYKSSSGPVRDAKISTLSVIDKSSQAFASPTRLPSKFPTRFPSKKPTRSPTRAPKTISKPPTLYPKTTASSRIPSALPTTSPTANPTNRFPSKKPTRSPTRAPKTISNPPTLYPKTTASSRIPSALPTTRPSISPNCMPTVAISASPTNTPKPKSLPLSTAPSSALSTTPTVDPIDILSSCLGPHLASQLYSPRNPGAGLTSFDWLQSSANSHIPMNPVAVLLLPNITFAAKAVTCAAVSGIQPVIRSGGHSSEGSSSLSNKLVIDLSYCNNLVSIFESPVGSGNYQAKFEAGMKLGQLYSALFNAGEWTIVGGVCPYVGAGGLLTGGGMGMLTRQYGLGIDQLTAVDIVLADGKSLTTSSTTNSDLFWALRGGGGASFGLVTHFTTHLFKLPTASMFFLKFSCSAEMLNLWQTFFVTAPNGVNAQFQMGISDTNINGQYDGPLTGPDGLQTLFQNAGILAMKTLVWYQFRTCSGLNARAFVIGGLNCAPDDLKLLYTYPIEPNAKDFHKSKTDNFNALMPQNVLQEIANMLLADPNTNIYGHSLGGDGLFASQSSSATPFFDRSAWHTIEYHYDSPVQNHYYPGSASYIWLNRISALVKPYTSGRKYLNYLDFDLPRNYGEMYWGWDNLQRLVSVKNKYDPTNFFNNPQSIPLALNYSSSEPTANPTTVPTFESTATPTAPTFRATAAPIRACVNVLWSQCGGRNFNGPTCCPANGRCTFANEYWSDCQPI